MVTDANSFTPPPLLPTEGSHGDGVGEKARGRVEVVMMTMGAGGVCMGGSPCGITMDYNDKMQHELLADMLLADMLPPLQFSIWPGPAWHHHSNPPPPLWVSSRC